MTSSLAALVIAAWEDYDRAVLGLAPADAARPIGSASSIAWSVAHVTQQLDSWINGMFQGLERQTLLRDSRFALGSAGLSGDDLDGIARAVKEVRERSVTFLEGIEDADLTLKLPYKGSLNVGELHSDGMTLGYALSRIVAHHYFHLGEIASVRVSLGHVIGDYPGDLRPILKLT